MKKTECPKCNKANCIKDGFMRGKQRKKRKKCNYKHTVKHRSGTATPEIKRHALHLYLEGLGFRSIGRLLNFSNVS
ncbi:MAG: IS1 family transposase, partial [Bacteroidetes bacterium]|nr:IS1 family transposase [Bacteroidota bacterium]